MVENDSVFAPGAPGGHIETRARAIDADTWRLEPHVCRQCFARVASQRTDDGRLYQCTNCGLEAVSAKPSAICACGLKLKRWKSDGSSAQALVDAGVRCHENRNRTPEFPSLYTASYGGVQADENAEPDL